MDGTIHLHSAEADLHEAEEQEESAEKLIQNVSSSDKAQIYNALIGNSEKEVGIHDDEQ